MQSSKKLHLMIADWKKSLSPPLTIVMNNFREGSRNLNEKTYEKCEIERRSAHATIAALIHTRTAPLSMSRKLFKTP